MMLYVAESPHEEDGSIHQCSNEVVPGWPQQLATDTLSFHNQMRCGFKRILALLEYLDEVVGWDFNGEHDV